MFFKMRKSREQAEGQTSVQAGDDNEGRKPEEGDTMAGDNIVIQEGTANLEEQVNKKTMDLGEADEQLEQLAGVDESRGEGGGGEGGEDLFTKPNSPQELTVDPEDEISGEEGNEAKDQLVPQSPVKTVQAERETSGEGKDLGSLLAGIGEEERRGRNRKRKGKRRTVYTISSTMKKRKKKIHYWVSLLPYLMSPPRNYMTKQKRLMSYCANGGSNKKKEQCIAGASAGRNEGMLLKNRGYHGCFGK